MYAECNEWSVTLYGENRDKDLKDLLMLVERCRKRGISFGSAFLFELPWLSDERKAEERWFPPYVWLPYFDAVSARKLLNDAGAESRRVRFKKVTAKWDDPPSFHRLLPP